MAKAMILMVAFVVIGFCIILFKGSAVVAPTEAEDAAVFEAPSLPNLQLKEKATAAGSKVVEGAKKAAVQAGALVEIKPLQLTLDRETVEVKPGNKVDVKVTRSGGEMKALKLALVPAPGSKISAIGGEFKAGAAETTITVEAQPGAQDAGLTLKAGNVAKVVPIKIK